MTTLKKQSLKEAYGRMFDTYKSLYERKKYLSKQFQEESLQPIIEGFKKVNLEVSVEDMKALYYAMFDYSINIFEDAYGLEFIEVDTSEDTYDTITLRIDCDGLRPDDYVEGYDEDSYRSNSSDIKASLRTISKVSKEISERLFFDDVDDIDYNKACGFDFYFSIKKEV